jgi:hypothetical protein
MHAGIGRSADCLRGFTQLIALTSDALALPAYRLAS